MESGQRGVWKVRHESKGEKKGGSIDSQKIRERETLTEIIIRLEVHWCTIGFRWNILPNVSHSLIHSISARSLVLYQRYPLYLLLSSPSLTLSFSLSLLSRSLAQSAAPFLRKSNLDLTGFYCEHEQRCKINFLLYNTHCHNVSAK